MDTVFIVMYHEYDDVQVMGVFTTRDLAQDYIDNFKPRREALNLDIDEHALVSA